ncbi:hypothetical protein BST95_13660 [Halioglobus japonicus]|uniref:DUF3570 domain-containing protein n=1 Tax=Halioglobus japonicus TaxID=930805 RepID=A0AAP8SPQ4_9GAMM|nr:DUF3570 domain-containing protein [Halioglobus japonicus]AQA19132.1 hypothetical protein BST95_13660 [Halioglobus japonicus]PLW87841.1 DUF3570 domain-containing protein [Halioglobus japonicus]GHD06281.1 hypothetical protein GCM10007052_00870 [Halioglobus japonicus]
MRDTDNPRLLALTSSALLLPAYTPVANADAPPEVAEAGIRYSKYQEDDLSRNKVILGSNERYDIDIYQAHLLTPIADDWSFALDVQREHMSGASPWFVGETADGGAAVFMSGASISDTRTYVGTTTRYYMPRGNAGLQLGYSDEDDYRSKSIGLDGAWNNSDNSRTWSGAVSYADDDISPTQGTIPTNVEDEQKDTASAWFGMTQILSQTALVRLGLSYSVSNGYLSDPYKLLDQRPDRRSRTTASASWRKFLIAPDAALHIDYRYYSDNWDIDSHTLRGEWHQTLGRFSLVPYVRYYSQSEADFFSVIADPAQRYFSDDYRLSSFGAVTLGARLVASMNNWRVTVAGERYRSDNSWSLYGGEEAPALVDFWRATLALDYRFE